MQALFFHKRAITVTKGQTPEWSDLIDPIAEAIESIAIPENVNLESTLKPTGSNDRPRSRSVLRPMDAPALKGILFDRSKAKKNGFKKRSIKKIETWEYCFKSAYECEHKMVIATFVQVDKEGLITNTYAEVHRVYITLMGEGKSEIMGNDLFPDDMDKAEEAIQAVLGDGAAPRPGKEFVVEDASSVSVEALKLLIGRNAESPQVEEFLARFSLRRSPTIMGAGSSYTNDGCRIELQTGGMGYIETIFLNPAPQDQWCEGLKAGALRDEIITKLGPPTNTSQEMGWDRFDCMEAAIHITYNRQTWVATKITLMDRATAP